ncbi:hypothetical protein V2G26_019225 [Clonostachys chloroleuca]
MTTRVVLVTGANGYIGNAVARAFVRAGWITYGLVRSPLSVQKLAAEEVIPVVGIIDSRETHQSIREALPARLDVIVSTTELLKDYGLHFENTVHLLRLLSASSTAAGRQPTVIFTSGCKDYGIGPHVHGEAGPPPHTEETPLRPPPAVAARTKFSVKIFDHTDVFWPVLVRPTNVFGRGSTYYQNFFAVAEQIADQGGGSSWRLRQIISYTRYMLTTAPTPMLPLHLTLEWTRCAVRSSISPHIGTKRWTKSVEH